MTQQRILTGLGITPAEVASALSDNKKDKPAESPVLNIAFLGTNQHRDNVAEHSILTLLGEELVADSMQSIHIIDGPGGASKSAENPMLGTYDISKVDYDPATGATKTKKTDREKNRASVAGGWVKGTGYHDAMEEAVHVVQQFINAHQSPITINLLGYSRGADTALRTCNMLKSYFGSDKFKVNIFAIDPVPGLGRKAALKARVIPGDIVGEYKAILMTNEYRADFEPIDKSRTLVQHPTKTNVNYQILCGVHSSGIKFRDPKLGTKYENTHHTPRLLWASISRFLTSHGARFKDKVLPELWKVADKKPLEKRNKLPMNQLAELKEYTAMIKSKVSSYDQLSDIGVLRNKTRDLCFSKGDYVLHGVNYFSDKYHQEITKKLFPHFFDYFFQKNAENSTRNDVLKDIEKITKLKEEKHKWLEDSLKTAGVFPDLNKALPPPKGLFFPASFQVLENKPLPQDEFTRLIQSINNVANAAKFESTSFGAEAELLHRNVLKILAADDAYKDKVLKETGRVATSEQFQKHCIVQMKREIRNTLTQLYLASPADLLPYRLKGLLDAGDHIALPLINLIQAENKIEKQTDPKITAMLKSSENYVMSLLSGDLSPAEKKAAIILEISKLMDVLSIQVKSKIPGASRLFNLIEQFAIGITKPSQNSFADFAMHRIQEKLPTSDPVKQKLFEMVLAQLKKLPPELRNHGPLLTEFLDIGMQALSHLRKSNNEFKEDKLDKVLRKVQSVLTDFYPQPIEPAQQKWLDQFSEQVKVVKDQHYTASAETRHSSSESLTNSPRIG